MVHSFRFAVIRLEPNDGRGERLNLGLVILRQDSLDVRISHLDRARVMSAALDKQVLIDILSNLRAIDEEIRHGADISDSARLDVIRRLGPLSITEAGIFTAESPKSYEDQVAIVLRKLIEPESAVRKVREKRTKLFSQVKNVLRENRILARKDEGLESHRIVAGYSLDEGLVADLVLRNGAYHVFETVDASGDEATIRKAVADIAISALVIERAKMTFGESATKPRLIYSTSVALEKLAQPSLDAAAHQGVELINWSSAQDRHNFLVKLSPLAEPISGSKNQRPVSFLQDKLFH